MTKREVMKLALDALRLEANRYIVCGAAPDALVSRAMEALRAELAKPEPEQVLLPELPEPEDCESLSFDAYSGMQMLKYGRACAEAQRKEDL